MTWILEHWDEVLEALAALYLLASIVVGLTPTPKDDEWLRRIVAVLSFLKPKDAPGTVKLPGGKP